MKGFLKSAVLAAALCFSAVTAHADNHIFNHLGVGVHAATTGFGFEAATPITKFVTLRAGVSIMPSFSFGADVNGTYDAPEGARDFSMHVDGGLKRTQGNIIFNIHPFAHMSSFYVAAGAYFGGQTVVKVTGHSDELREQAAHGGSVEIGEYQLPIDANGNVDGSLEVKKFRPYLGIGFGRAVPKGRLHFGVELGVQFQGKMKVCSNGKELDQTLTGNDDDWQKVIDKLKVYPVLKFTLSGRIF